MKAGFVDCFAKVFNLVIDIYIYNIITDWIQKLYLTDRKKFSVGKLPVDYGMLVVLPRCPCTHQAKLEKHL